MLADWIVWIPINLVNFSYVPVGYQSLVVSISSFFFRIIISYIAFEKKIEPEQTKASIVV